MKEKKLHYIKELAYFGSIGFSVAFAVFIGVFIGIFLDKYFDTNPWFTLIWLVFGIVAGFKNIGHAIRKVEKDSK